MADYTMYLFAQRPITHEWYFVGLKDDWTPEANLGNWVYQVHHQLSTASGWYEARWNPHARKTLWSKANLLDVPNELKASLLLLKG